VKRRTFIAALGSAVAWPVVARAQQGDRIKRLGILRGGSELDPEAPNKALLDGLAQFGWTEGQNLRIDYRLVGTNDANAIRPHAEALVRAAPDVIFATPATAVQVLQRVTRTIPIVFIQTGHPVRAGIVQSLVRPDGNLTGFVNFEPSINTKYLQFLKDIAPQVTRVEVLQTRATTFRGDFEVIEAIARSFAVVPSAVLVRDDVSDIERAIVAFAREPNGGLILPPDNTTTRHRALIIALAAKLRLPAVHSSRQWVDAGGLLSYAAASTDYRQVASYVDRILRGAKLADLPVQLPIKYQLVVNLKTAKALGLTVPQTLLVTADEVIE
jgi:putative ABC transport system substrate-binding protein